MRVLSLVILLLALVFLAGCGSQSARDETWAERGGRSGVTGDFAGSPGVDAFVRRMQAHGYQPRQTAAILSRAERKQGIIDLMDRQAPRRGSGPNGAWTRYRAKFLTDDNIANGVSFWRRNASALDRAESRYGVPPEYIVAIIGVETRYGGFVGQTRLIDALATLSFAYPRRATYFQNELEDFLIMAREEGLDPFRPRGSFAGAMGLCQFMPSSFREHAVDFTGDGHRNLWDSEDAIGSVANYFKHHGWRTGEAVVVRARVEDGANAGVMKAGFDTRYSVRDLSARGIYPAASAGDAGQVSLLQLDTAGGYEYWLGLTNFYVITRYNHSTYYAMAVHQLARAIRAARGGQDGLRLSSTW
jgi:membrane-bound lytic murein transglycosylase B